MHLKVIYLGRMTRWIVGAGGFVLTLGASSLAGATPSRAWGTYYGGASYEQAVDVDFTSGPAIDVVGRTESSSGIATLGSHDNGYSGDDAFVAQFDGTGARVWATYYGGAGEDAFNALVHNQSDDIYAFGTTSSTGFIATLGAHQTTLSGGLDGMLVKFNTSGTRTWGTYFGGNGLDQGLGICVAATGTVYIVGNTSSTNLATVGAHQTSKGGDYDGFVAKVTSSGSVLWTTYYGGNDADVDHTYARDCAVDSSNNVYVVGETLADNGIATTGAHDTTLGGPGDAFLVKFNTNGVRQWGTYFGGPSGDAGHAVDVDASGNVYIAGDTISSSGIATTGAHDTTLTSGYDAFLAKFNASGVRQWSTYFGGSQSSGGSFTEEFNDIEVFESNIYLSGRTSSDAGVVTTGAWDSSNLAGKQVGMFVQFTTAGVLTFASFNGQEDDMTVSDAYAGVAVSREGLGQAAIVGRTNASSGVATAGAHDTTFNGAHDGVITYINL